MNNIEIIKTKPPESRQEIIDILKYVLALAHDEPIDKIKVIFEIDGIESYYEFW